MRFIRRTRRYGVAVGLAVCAAVLSLAGAAAAQPQVPQDLDAALRKALEAPGWSELPKPIIAVRHSGPTHVAGAPGGWSPPGPVWYLTRPPDANSRPNPSAQQEQAFVRSVEAAHAGR